MKRAHAMPFGAQTLDGRNTRFRLWAPSARSVELVVGEQRLRLDDTGDGWREIVAEAPPGTRYRYGIDDELEVPDPASRYNPGDVYGPSEVIDPLAYEWRDARWRGRPWSEAVVYELHVGAFSREGTFAGVEAKLDYLAELGITAIELMPLADFPGQRNWGYDGVLPFAPDASYGRPEDLKRLIDAAHARNLMIMLDVVYNHFGPEGNYLPVYAKPFFTDRHPTAWGAAIDYGSERARPVRELFIHNALYWLGEFHFDGLRFDAVHAIFDDSTPHILNELAETVRHGPGASREIHLVLENEHNESRYLEYRDAKPRWYDAQWNDDEHHAFHVLLTGEKDGYYADYANGARQLGRCLAEGFAYQGDASVYREGEARGEPSAHLPPTAFVTFVQNHDQIGNRALGERISALAPADKLRAGITAWLLAPSPPMLFMGEEFAAATPFLFFCDFAPELAKAVTEGRRREFARFERFADPTAQSAIPDPNAVETFERSKLDWQSIGDAAHASSLDLYKRLLDTRRREIAPRLDRVPRGARYDVLSDAALRVEWRLAGATLTLYLNLSDAAIAVRAPDAGTLLHAEPAAAAQALAKGTLPRDAAAVYLNHG